MKTFTRLFVLFSLALSLNAGAQYCTLPGRVPYSSLQPGITNFKLNTINRTSLGVENMSAVLVVTNDSTVLVRGNTYTVYITHNRDSVYFPTARNNIRVWIDYNNNMSFDDAGELVITADYKNYGVFSASFTVPMTAPVGTVRLRATVKMSSDAGHSLPTSCDMPADGLGYHGEMEDYKVKIQAPAAISGPEAASQPVVVYPNPTAGKFTVDLGRVSEQPVVVALYDITGAVVAKLLNETSPQQSAYNFDLDQYNTPVGMYIVKVTVGDVSSYHKVVRAE